MTYFLIFLQSILFILFIYHRLNGIITSGIIWTFLFFNSICSGILVLDIYLYNESSYLRTEIYVIIFNFLFNALLFIICSFTDNAYQAGLRKKSLMIINQDEEDEIKKDVLDKDRYNESEYRQSPETYQSFPSSIFFSWSVD